MKPFSKMALATISVVGSSFVALSAGLLPALDGCCNHAAAETKEIVVQKYTCPMSEHADVVSDKPGRCPKCGMDLIKAK